MLSAQKQDQWRARRGPRPRPSSRTSSTTKATRSCARTLPRATTSRAASAARVGFSKEQILQFYVENEQMVDAKKQSAQEDKDADWKAHLGYINKMIDHADAEQKADIKEVTAEHRRQLKQQAVEQEARKAASKNERFGTVDNGFFDGFGSSYR